MKYFLLLFFFFNIIFAEISLGIGQTSGKYLQFKKVDGTTYYKQAPLAGRPLFFVELDAKDHPLWLKNDQVVIGAMIMAETRHHDWASKYNNTTYLPLYIHYYLNFTNYWSLGLGINFNIMTLRYKNDTLTIVQQIGKSLLLRYNFNQDYFVDFGVMQTCAATTYSNDIEAFYDATNYIIKLGYYFEKNKY